MDETKALFETPDPVPVLQNDLITSAAKSSFWNDTVHRYVRVMSLKILEVRDERGSFLL